MELPAQTAASRPAPASDRWRPPPLGSEDVRLGRKLLPQVATIVTPETTLAWHRKLVGRAMTAGRRSSGRPQKSRDLAGPGREDGEGDSELVLPPSGPALPETMHAAHQVGSSGAAAPPHCVALCHSEAVWVSAPYASWPGTGSSSD